MASHRHGYDYKGHDLEQELLHSSIVSRIYTLSHLLYTLDITHMQFIWPIITGFGAVDLVSYTIVAIHCSICTMYVINVESG